MDKIFYGTPASSLTPWGAAEFAADIQSGSLYFHDLSGLDPSKAGWQTLGNSSPQVGVLSYGARGDAQQALDGFVSQSSPVFVTSANHFSPSDVGKTVSLQLPVPLENYNTYTKVDAGAFLTVGANSVTSSAIPQASTVELYKDYGTGFFTGPFTQYMDFKETHGGSGSTFNVVWALSNTAGGIGTGDIYVQINDNGSAATLFALESGGASSAGLSINVNTQYWLTIALSGTTFIVSVYSNSGRTNLVGTQTITLTGVTAWRYVYAYHNAGGTSTATTVILSENLNISGLVSPTIFTSAIASYQGPTQVTLTTPSPGAGSNLTYAWGTDNTALFNNALQAASIKGISTVSVPCGIYLFAGSISIPEGVTLKGTVPGPFLPRWEVPSNVTTVPQLWPVGTTGTGFIQMFVRQNAVANGTNVITGLSDTSKLRVGQIVQIVNGSGTVGLTGAGGPWITSIDSPTQVHVNSAAAFSGACTLTGGVNDVGVEDLLIYHPTQILVTNTNAPIVFPPAIQVIGSNGYKIRRVTTVNAYVGIANGWGDIFTYGILSGSGWLQDLYLGTLSVAMATDHSADVVHTRGVHVWPIYDMFDPTQTTPHDYPTNLDTWVQANGNGLTYYRADQAQVIDAFVFGKNIGVLGTTSPDTSISPNNGYGNFTNLTLDTVKTGVTVNAAQGPWSINNIGASVASGVASGGNMLATANGAKLTAIGGNVTTNGWGASALNQGAGSTLVADFILGIGSDNVLTITQMQLNDFGSAPTSAGTAGTAGQIVFHAGILYLCTVTGAAGAATWNKFNLTAV